MTSYLTSSPWKQFFLHTLGWYFHFYCPFKAVYNISTCSKCRHFEPANFFYQKWYLLIDALAQILRALLEFKLLTYFEIWWRHQWCILYLFIYSNSQSNDTNTHQVQWWYICYLFSYHEKSSFFIYKEYRGTILRSSCDVIDDVINMKILVIA